MSNQTKIPHATRAVHADQKTGFASTVIAWQKVHGRHDLPWQNTRDPYHVWLSEVMLQQTQVNTALAYYEPFLRRFPNLSALAAAPLPEVLEAWAGLGYYARARNLHRTARLLCEQNEGIFPTKTKTLQSLPGIGPSTAGAIASLAWHKPAAILDGNVKRVLCRYFGVEGYPGDAAVQKRLWSLAESLLPNARNIASYTQGLMDLGAGLCARNAPKCTHCPLAKGCVARQAGRTEQLPTRHSRRRMAEKNSEMVVIVHAAKVLVKRRAPTGVWGGLLALPEGDWRDVGVQAGMQLKLVQKLPLRTHALTHFRLNITPVLCVPARPPAAIHEPALQWLPLSQVCKAALPAPLRRLLIEVAEGTNMP